MGKKGRREGRKERERKKIVKRMREGWTEDREGEDKEGGRERKAEREKQTCQNINICYIQMKIHWYLLYCCNFSKGF